MWRVAPKLGLATGLLGGLNVSLRGLVLIVVVAAANANATPVATCVLAPAHRRREHGNAPRALGGLRAQRARARASPQILEPGAF